MCFIVQNDDVPGRCHFAQHFANVGLVTLGPALVHATALGNLGVRLPIELVPILDPDAALSQFVVQRRWDDAELVVVVSRRIGNQHRQPVLYRQAGRDDEHILRKPRVLRKRRLIQNLPCDEHRHHDRLARAGGELRTPARKRAAVAGNSDPLRLRRGCFRQPNGRLDRLHLAKEEAASFALIRIVPMFEQPPRDTGHARIASRPPSIDSGTDLIH